MTDGDSDGVVARQPQPRLQLVLTHAMLAAVAACNTVKQDSSVVRGPPLSASPAPVIPPAGQTPAVERTEFRPSVEPVVNHDPRAPTQGDDPLAGSRLSQAEERQRVAREKEEEFFRKMFGPDRPLLTTNTRSGTFANEPGFVPMRCDATIAGYSFPSFVDELRLARPVDSIELWTGRTLFQGTGTPCSRAPNAAACRRRLQTLPFEPGFIIGNAHQLSEDSHLRATSGDEVLRIGTMAELKAFLGAIDSLGDAELWVASHNYSLECGKSGARKVANGSEVLAFTYPDGCKEGSVRHLLHVGADGTLTTLDRFVEREPIPGCISGRRPEGLRQSPGDLRASMGSFFAHSAALEAASVPAFLRLARELRQHDAPASLVARAVAAAHDEVRHARAVGELARAFGGQPALWSAPSGGVRELEAVALENAIEGCVRETYGALVAWHQQQAASDARIRAVYRRIAVDETRHAALSWAVARWAEPRLPAAARRRVQAARRAAATELIAQVRSTPAAEHDSFAGLPSSSLGSVLASQLERALWRLALCA